MHYAKYSRTILDNIFIATYTLLTMSTTEPAILNLSKLLTRDPHAIRELSQEGSFIPNQEFSTEEYRLEGPLDWSISIYPTGGDDEFLLTGNVSGQVTMDCRRCLEGVKINSSSKLLFTTTFDPKLTEPVGLIEGEDDDILVFSETQVDFSDILTQIFMVDLPLTAVCENPDTCNDLRNIIADDSAEIVEDESTESGNPFAALKDIKLES